jgi:hypothetical protein
MPPAPHPLVRASLAAWLTGATALAAATPPGAQPGTWLAPLAEASPWQETAQRLAQAELMRDLAEQSRMFEVADELVIFAGQEMAQQRVIKGAPYCAEAVHETVQPLADGNRIVRKSSSQLCRDGEGRTRQELIGRDGRKRTYLRDPVANEAWVLDDERKLARRIQLRTKVSVNVGVPETGMTVTTSQSWQQYSDAMREWARTMVERVRPGAGGERQAGQTASSSPGPTAAARTSAGALPAGSAAVAISPGAESGLAELRILRIGQPAAPPAVVPALPSVSALPPGAAAAPVPPLPPQVVVDRAWSAAPRGAGSVQPLPGREIEGVRVNGERTSWTIEAGRVGNEKPIVITREIWTSPDLMLTVHSRDFDPRSGEVNYRLQQIRRGEPDANLMRVPTGFQRIGLPAAPAANKG